MNSETVGNAKRVVRPAAKRGVYMDFAAQGKKPAAPVAAAASRQSGPVVLRPDARAAQANARIAQRQAQLEARQRAMRLAKAGVPGRAPGLEGTARPTASAAKVARVARPASKPLRQARVAQSAARPVARSAQQAATQPSVAQRQFVAKPAAQPEPQRPLSRGQAMQAGQTVADAQAAATRAEAKRQATAAPRVQRTGVTVAQVTDTPAGRLVEQETYEEIDFGVIEDYQGDEPAVAEEAPEVAKVPEKGPNWPFLKSVTVEKRPLSGKKPTATKVAAPRPTTVTPAASSIALNSGVARQGSKLPMVGLILLTIILGVAVGAAVYFAIFQGGGPE